MRDPHWGPIYVAWAEAKGFGDEVEFLIEVDNYAQEPDWITFEGLVDGVMKGTNRMPVGLTKEARKPLDDREKKVLPPDKQGPPSANVFDDARKHIIGILMQTYHLFIADHSKKQ